MHAAHEAGAKFGDPANCYLIAVTLPSESDLLDFQGYLESQGIKTLTFQEPDLGNQTTALAALTFNKESKYFSRLPLWRLQ